jgi:hypothetical protein
MNRNADDGARVNWHQRNDSGMMYAIARLSGLTPSLSVALVGRLYLDCEVNNSLTTVRVISLASVTLQTHGKFVFILVVADGVRVTTEN